MYVIVVLRELEYGETGSLTITLKDNRLPIVTDNWDAASANLKTVEFCALSDGTICQSQLHSLQH
jgi:hypothetical protein